MCVLGFYMNTPIHYLCRDGSLQREGAGVRGGCGLLRICEETSAGYRASDWKLVDERITELGVERAAHEHEVCRRLLEAERLGVAARVGFASLRGSVSSNRPHNGGWASMGGRRKSGCGLGERWRGCRICTRRCRLGRCVGLPCGS